MKNIICPQTACIYHCVETGREYFYDGEWVVVEPAHPQEENEVTAGMTLYDLNKMIMIQRPVMTEEEINNHGRKSLEAFYNCKVSHYMLLCKDLSYYTVFEKGAANDGFIDTVLEIVNSLGALHDMFINDDGVLEFWIAPPDSEEVFAFFLFPYDLGVVYYA